MLSTIKEDEEKNSRCSQFVVSKDKTSRADVSDRSSLDRI